MDTTKKLHVVTVLPVKNEIFKHYIEIQGVVQADKNIEINPEFRELLSDISAGQKGNTWVNRRDTSLHEYVSVFNDNIKFTAQMRDSFNRRTAELGVKLAIKTVRLTAKLLSSRADNLKL